MLTWVIVAAIVTIAIWNYGVKSMTYWSNRGVCQTKPMIIVGDTWNMMLSRTNLCDFTQWLYNLYPNKRYLGFYSFTKPILIVREPELIKQIAIKDFDSFTDHRPFIDPDADPLWNKTLFALRGNRWKEMRNIVSPTFTSSKIKNMFVLMVETAENFVNYFNEKDDEVIELEMKEAYTRYTNDVIATTAFGVKVDSLKEQNNMFFLMGQRITNLGGFKNAFKFILTQAFPKLFKNLRITLFEPTAAEYFSGVIYDTIKVREEKHIVRPDIINILLEARKQQYNENSQHEKINGKSNLSVEITNIDIASQALIFFFAGFDTISTAMSFGSYELGLNKDVQDRLREEIQETAKKGKIDYETLQQMTYMDMVVSEILRKWPPFPTTDRKCTKAYTIEPVNDDEKPVYIPKGTEVWIPVYGIHRDPKYFPNPEKFDPERFSDENKSTIVPYSNIPFGIGPRICIGNRFALVEIKALLFYLLLNYEIVPTKKTAIPLVLKNDFQIGIEGGLWMGLKRIKATC